MVALLDPIQRQAQPQPRHHRSPNLLLHCGARAVERVEIQRVFTPPPTETWTPIPHIQLVTQVEQTLRTNGLIVGNQAHSLSHEGARYFGLMEIQREESEEDYCWVLGLRNSHDKTFPAGITAGAQVLVCDNLSFSGEVKLARKHTRFICRDLPRLVQSAVGKLMERWHHQDARLATYKLADLDDRAPHDLVIRACDVGVVRQPEADRAQSGCAGLWPSGNLRTCIYSPLRKATRWPGRFLRSRPPSDDSSETVSLEIGVQ